MDSDALREAAADYVAGDLDAQDEEAFADLLAQNENLQKEVAFWQQMREEMPAACRPINAEPAGPALISAAKRQLQREDIAAQAQDRPQSNRFANIGWGVAVAAAAFAIALLIRSPATTTSFDDRMVAISEDSSAIVLPVNWQQHNVGMPQLHYQANAKPMLSDPVAVDPQTKPWIGLWTRPIDLPASVGTEHGLQVVRIVDGSPAYQSGLRPGDVLLKFGVCPTNTRFCILKAMRLGQSKPGDRIPLTFLQAKSMRVIEAEVMLGAVLE